MPKQSLNDLNSSDSNSKIDGANYADCSGKGNVSNVSKNFVFSLSEPDFT